MLSAPSTVGVDAKTIRRSSVALVDRVGGQRGCHDASCSFSDPRFDRPMPGLKRYRTASVVIRGHAFIQNIRRGHHELGTDISQHLRIAAAFDERAEAI